LIGNKKGLGVIETEALRIVDEEFKDIVIFWILPPKAEEISFSKNIVTISNDDYVQLKLNSIDGGFKGEVFSKLRKAKCVRIELEPGYLPKPFNWPFQVKKQLTKDSHFIYNIVHEPLLIITHFRIISPSMLRRLLKEKDDIILTNKGRLILSLILELSQGKIIKEEVEIIVGERKKKN